MGFWFRLRLGPFGYTAHGRRKPQSYRAYKESRERRQQYAERYNAERRGAEAEAARITPSLQLTKPDRDPELAGVGLATLRTWLVYWQEIAEGTRQPDQPDHVQRAPSEAAKIATEIEARTGTAPAKPHLRGRTSQEFDGVSTTVLRAWLRYQRSVVEGTREPMDGKPDGAAEAARLIAEIEARGERVE